MRLSKLELEPLLQPDLHLLGNVATKRLGDLWQLDHRLHQQDNRANQNELSKLYGRKGANILTHQGFIPIHPRSEGTLSSGPSVLQRLQKGHRNCEHLFWGVHSVWWVTTLFSVIEQDICSRICEITKDDLVGLYLRLRRPLWTMPWDQLCVYCWDSLLVLHQIVQEFESWKQEIIV